MSAKQTAAARAVTYRAASMPPALADALPSVLDRARLQVLRATVLIGFLIAAVDLAGALAGFTASGNAAQGPAASLALGWCLLWALAARVPVVTKWCFTRYATTAIALGVLTALTVGLTGGIDSPNLAVSLYAGWIASVVVNARPAIAVSLTISIALFVGYFIAGDSVAEVFTGPYRYAAVTNAALPLFAGLVGVLLATVVSANFGRLTQPLATRQRDGFVMPPAMTELRAGQPSLARPLLALRDSRWPTVDALTRAEREVVAALADGHRPKQIAYTRGVALSTVRSQIKSAKEKTGARTISELILLVDEPRR